MLKSFCFKSQLGKILNYRCMVKVKINRGFGFRRSGGVTFSGAGAVKKYPASYEFACLA